MTRSTRHCEDPTMVWVNGDIGYKGTETCKIVLEATPAPTQPTPLGDPPF